VLAKLLSILLASSLQLLLIFFSPFSPHLIFVALPIMLRNLFTEICVLKMWEGMTVKATVISAAGKFKRLIRRSVVNPYAIAPVVDGRITNIQETVLAS